MGYRVVVVGATGNVGREMLNVLAEREFPIEELAAVASPRSTGDEIEFGETGRMLKVRNIEHFDFTGWDIALFSAGSDVAKTYGPKAAGQGCVVIDNSSFYRMDPDVPLIVPEVNPEAIDGYKAKNIIANPNCSTAQMVVALKPLHDAAGLQKVVVTTYQSTSGAGKKGMDELHDQTVALLNSRPFEVEVHHARIAFNVVPHIGAAGEDGYTEEELKLLHETRKIMGLPGLRVSPTAVRVPVFACHSESVVCEFDRPLTPQHAREVLEKAPGIKVVDDLAQKLYPMPMDAAGTDEVYVGRIRRDLASDNGLALWVVADNLRKGAATNAVQIAQLAIKAGLVHGARA